MGWGNPRPVYFANVREIVPFVIRLAARARTRTETVGSYVSTLSLFLQYSAAAYERCVGIFFPPGFVFLSFSTFCSPTPNKTFDCIRDQQVTRFSNPIRKRVVTVRKTALNHVSSRIEFSQKKKKKKKKRRIVVRHATMISRSSLENHFKANPKLFRKLMSRNTTRFRPCEPTGYLRVSRVTFYEKRRERDFERYSSRKFNNKIHSPISEFHWTNWTN